MAVLDRRELESSSLADLHAIADQLGLEGFRRLRKAELIDTILAGPAGAGAVQGESGDGAAAATPAATPVDDLGGPEDERAIAGESEPAPAAAPRRRRPSLRVRRPRRDEQSEEREETASAEGAAREEIASAESAAPERREEIASAEGAARERRDSPRAARRGAAERPGREERPVEGVVELLGNGSAFVRVNPPESSPEDVYVSAAQVRRCELVNGDRVGGPARAPRRSERYAALVKVETINGRPAGEVAEGSRYEDRPVAYPCERLELDGADATLQAIEWLTPFGRGSRVLIVGPARSGKTAIARRLLGALATDRGSAGEGLEVTVLLAGVRPEETAEWSEGPVAPATPALTFAASPETRGQALEQAVEAAKRTAARGGDALVLIDTLEGLHPHTARKIMAAARNLADGGSLTIVATAREQLGGETTVIALEPALGLAGGPPLDLAASGTVRAELLVGEEGAAAIARARADALTAH